MRLILQDDFIQLYTIRTILAQAQNSTKSRAFICSELHS